MANGSEEARFSLSLENRVSGPAEEAAGSLDELRQKILDEQRAMKELIGAQGRLRGSTEEIKAAKEELRSKIEASRRSIAAMQLGVLKAGTSLEQLGAKSKQAAESSGRMGRAVETAGGPLASVRGKVVAMREQLAGIKGGAALAVFGLGLFVAAVTAATVAVAGAVVSLSRFVLRTVDASRSANLLREAATGSAENAHALGTQVEALATQLPTARGELNALAVSMAKGGLQGQTLVDAFKATAQASAALGDDVGNTVRDIVQRGAALDAFGNVIHGAFRLDPRETFGKGLGPQFFQEVAAELASGLKVSTKQAQAALFEGRVKLADGAAAIRKAVEKKFGDINLRKAMSLESLGVKLRETFASLTSGVKLEPLLRQLSKMLDIFNETTVTGAAIKRFVTEFGEKLVTVLEKAAPLAKKFVQGLVIGALNVEVAWLRARLMLAKAIGRDVFKSAIDGAGALGVALKAGELAVYAFAGAVAVAATGLAALGAIGAAIAAPFVYFGKIVAATYEAVRDTPWKELGAAVIDGIVGGIKAKIGELERTLSNVGGKMRAAMAGSLGIRSPSKVFAELGEYSAEGYAIGVERRAPKARAAVEGMAAPPARGGGGGQKSAGPVQITVTINVEGGGSKAIAAAAAQQSFLSQLQDVLEKAVATGLVTT